MVVVEINAPTYKSIFFCAQSFSYDQKFYTEDREGLPGENPRRI
jgi:hypothetical protein